MAVRILDAGINLLDTSAAACSYSFYCLEKLKGFECHGQKALY
jgi:hypothetical protein